MGAICVLIDDLTIASMLAAGLSLKIVKLGPRREEVIFGCPAPV
jgi:hypothetical protein